MQRILQKPPLNSIFKKEKFNSASLLSANYFSNSILINNGNWSFSLKELPWEAQLTPYRDAAIADVNNDNRPDILLAGNFYPNNIQMGEYDGDYGTVLINQGNGNFKCESLNGYAIKGEVRHIRKINIEKKKTFIVARNNDSVKIIQFH